MCYFSISFIPLTSTYLSPEWKSVSGYRHETGCDQHAEETMMTDKKNYHHPTLQVIHRTLFLCNGLSFNTCYKWQYSLLAELRAVYLAAWINTCSHGRTVSTIPKCSHRTEGEVMRSIWWESKPHAPTHVLWSGTELLNWDHPPFDSDPRSLCIVVHKLWYPGTSIRSFHFIEKLLVEIWLFDNLWRPENFRRTTNFRMEVRLANALVAPLSLLLTVENE